VRPWLVVLGSIIAVIGVGLVISLFLLLGGTVTTGQFRIDNPAIGPHSNWVEVVSRPISTQSSVSISWTTTAPANVTLTPAAPCSSVLGVCPTGPPVLNWTLVQSGKGTGASGNVSQYLLEVRNPGASTIAFTGVVSVNYNPNPPLPVWSLGLILVAGIILLAIGGIAVFLGLFLPTGVYDEPEDPSLGPFEPPPPEPPA
jgi:hypothetical protein